MPKQSMIVYPSVEQVKSGKVPRPENVYVSTELAELPGGHHIFLRSLWEIDYIDEKLVLLEGVLQMNLVLDPLFGPPDSHLRAVRKVAAAVFGKKRFRGEVEIYEAFQGEIIYRATHNDETWILPTREDALIWAGMKDGKTPQIEEILLTEYLNENPDVSKKELLQKLDQSRILLQIVTKSLYQRIRSGKSASKELDGIKQAGFSTKILTESYLKHAKMMSKIRAELENESN